VNEAKAAMTMSAAASRILWLKAQIFVHGLGSAKVLMYRACFYKETQNVQGQSK
jgi:hypothetical protein